MEKADTCEPLGRRLESPPVLEKRSRDALHISGRAAEA